MDRRRTVKTICNGEVKVCNDLEEAQAFFLEMMMNAMVYLWSEV